MVMLMGPGVQTTRLGASLRDRATLPSPLRGLDPSGGYPSRLRALRALRTPFARRLAALPAECRADTVRDFVRRHRQPSPLVSSSPRRYAPRSSRNSLRSPWPAAPADGLRLGSSPSHSVRRRCRLRRAPCRAVVPAQVRTLPPALPPPFSARPRAVPSALPPAQTPRRLRPAGFAGVDSPIAHTADLAVPYRRGGLGSHTRRIVDAGCGMDHHRRDRPRSIMTARTKVRV